MDNTGKREEKECPDCSNGVTLKNGQPADCEECNGEGLQRLQNELETRKRTRLIDRIKLWTRL